MSTLIAGPRFVAEAHQSLTLYRRGALPIPPPPTWLRVWELLEQRLEVSFPEELLGRFGVTFCLDCTPPPKDASPTEFEHERWLCEACYACLASVIVIRDRQPEVT